MERGTGHGVWGMGHGVLYVRAQEGTHVHIHGATYMYIHVHMNMGMCVLCVCVCVWSGRWYIQGHT